MFNKFYDQGGTKLCHVVLVQKVDLREVQKAVKGAVVKVSNTTFPPFVR